VALSDFSEQPEPLSPELEADIAESGQRFEAKLTPFKMFIGPSIPGWVEEYKEELRELARKWRKS
jgi:hypothetical protein